MRDIDVVRFVGEQPWAVFEHLRQWKFPPAEHLAAAGDLGAEVGGELTVQAADQAACAGGSSRFFMGRQSARKR